MGGINGRGTRRKRYRRRSLHWSCRGAWIFASTDISGKAMGEQCTSSLTRWMGKSGRDCSTFAAVDEAHVAQGSQTDDSKEGPELDFIVGTGRLGRVGSALLAERSREALGESRRRRGISSRGASCSGESRRERGHAGGHCDVEG